MLAAIKGQFVRLKEKALARQIKKAGFFDPSFYIFNNPDVAVAGQDPLLHFVRHGAAEGRSPSPKFNLPVYLQDNPAAQVSGLNPVIDWLIFGKEGDRKPPISVDYEHSVVGAEQLSYQEFAELRSIANATGLFDETYYLTHYPDIKVARVDPFQHYMLIGHLENRNPSSLFDTYFYETEYRELLSEKRYGRALVHYLKEGREAGLKPRPPNSVTLRGQHTPQRKQRLAVHLHLFYVEMAELFALLLKKTSLEFDVFITGCGDANVEFLEHVFKRLLPDHQLNVRDVPNRGRDVAPFLLAFPELWLNYDAVLHLHSKKSPHTDFGASWCEWCLNHLLAHPDIIQSSLRHLEEHPDVAMLFPDNYFKIKKFANWNGSEGRISTLLARFGTEPSALPRYPHFSASSMGWYRADVFRSLVQRLTWADFEEEEGQVEGTLAHVMERAMPVYALACGRTLSTFYLPELPAFPVIETLHASASGVESVGDRWMRDTPFIARWRPRPLKPYTQLYNPKALDISWIIPDFVPGAGGHMTIFRMVEFLESFGHRQTLWIQNPRNYPSTASVLAAIRQHYRKVGEKVAVRFLPDDVRQLSGDVVIATDCWTVFPAATATNFKERFYFIQDFEPYFHPVGENYLIAESTYKMNFAALCAGEWLLQKAQAYGMWARKWELASDPKFYFPRSSKMQFKQNKFARIVFYNRSYTPRRAVNLGLAAFDELSRRRSDFEVLMFGQAPENRAYEFEHQELGNLSPAHLGELYREADVGVAFSSTNHSLVPLEMMACDLPVVEIDTESTRIAYPHGTVSLSIPDPLSIADAIERLLDNKTARNKQISVARDFVSRLDWKRSAHAFEAALLERLAEIGARPVDINSLSAPARIRCSKASIIIPTYNGGALFKEVLTRVVRQKSEFDFDVFVIDSSSDDGTADFVGELGGRVQLKIIDKAEFQHGRTRNLAISCTDGEIVALLTQDAMPIDDSWLENLVGGFDYGPRIAGVIGRHIAYPHHNPLVARDLERMFDRFADLGPIFNLDRGLPNFLPRGGIEWQMIQHFYSDNNSAMRRSVWKELPYPEVDWGEDQVWAWTMLKLGFSKAYAHDAIVFHSHEFSHSQQTIVAVSEGKLFAEHFGYILHPGRFDEATFQAFVERERLNASKLGLSQPAVDAYVSLVRRAIEGRMLGSKSSDAELKNG